MFFLSPLGMVKADTLQDAFGDKLKKTAGGAGYKDATAEDVDKMIGTVIQTILSLLGIIFLILIIYAGFTWMTARGDEGKVTQAKDTMRNSIIGLVIVVAAYAISYFVLDILTKQTMK